MQTVEESEQLVRLIERTDMSALTLAELRELADAIEHQWPLDDLSLIAERLMSSGLEPLMDALDGRYRPHHDPVNINEVMSVLDAFDFKQFSTRHIERIGRALFRWASPAEIRRFIALSSGPADVAVGQPSSSVSGAG